MKKKSKPRLPTGWRYLKTGDAIHEADQTWDFGNPGRWVHDSLCAGQTYSAKRNLPRIRNIEYEWLRNKLAKLNAALSEKFGPMSISVRRKK